MPRKKKTEKKTFLSFGKDVKCRARLKKKLAWQKMRRRLQKNAKNEDGDSGPDYVPPKKLRPVPRDESTSSATEAFEMPEISDATLTNLRHTSSLRPRFEQPADYASSDESVLENPMDDNIAGPSPSVLQRPSTDSETEIDSEAEIDSDVRTRSFTYFTDSDNSSTDDPNDMEMFNDNEEQDVSDTTSTQKINLFEETVQDREDDDTSCYATFLSNLASSGLSRKKVQEVFDYVNHNIDYIQHLRDGEKLPKTARSLTNRALKNIPRVKMHYKYKHKISGADIDSDDEEAVSEIREGSGLTIPKMILKKAWRIQQICAWFTIEDVIKYHIKTHNLDASQTPIIVSLSSDGVAPSKSGHRKMHVLSIAIEGCESVYPLAIWEYKSNEYKPSCQELYGRYVEELLALEGAVKCKTILADSLERKYVKGMRACNFHTGCDFCLATCAKSMNRQAYKVDKKWPLRTTKMFQDAVANYTEKELDDTKKDPGKGVNRTTPLIHLEKTGFSFIWDIPIDSLHLLHLGITKMLLTLLLESTKGPLPPQGRKQMEKSINKLLKKTRLPSMFARRTRQLKIAKYKASEFNLMDCFVFPAIAATCKVDKISAMLADYSFLCRALYIDDEGFEDLRQDLDTITTRFLKSVVALFAGHHITYNFHVLVHAVESRARTGAVWKTSTARFESSYSNLLSSFVPGTPNIAKQAMENYYLKDHAKHFCLNKHQTPLKDSVSEKTNDSLVKAKGKFYKIDKISDDWGMICRRIKVEPYSTDSVQRFLPWDKVGVWKNKGTHPKKTLIQKEDVQASLVSVGNLLIEAKHEWLVW